MKHISIRVPWHDNGWNGSLCADPDSNTFCKVLPKIAMRPGACDCSAAGCRWTDRPQECWPACAGENGAFMSPHAYTRVFEHVYSPFNGPHSALRPTLRDVPAYSAFGIPYRYMSLDRQDEITAEHPEFSPPEVSPRGGSWLYGAARMRDILDWFHDNVSDEGSLCIFYCKNGNPVDDDGQRLIVGMGEVAKVHDVCDYDSVADYTYPMWEILFEHTIRPDLGKSRGFLLPYRQYLELDEEFIKKTTGMSRDEALDEIKISLDSLGGSAQMLNELSYGCEFVSDRSMLTILQSAGRAVEAVIRHRLVGGDWTAQLEWIKRTVARVKRMITPFPAFAEALKAIGVNYPYLVEHDLRAAGCGPKDDPWKFYSRLLDGDILPQSHHYAGELETYRAAWNYFTDKSKQVLRLLSRFEITSDIIKSYIVESGSPLRHDDILGNPYLLSEVANQRHDNRVNTGVIDMGVIADVDIQGENIPESPSAVNTLIDKRRLRSLVIERLCRAVNDGDTLLSIAELEEYVNRELAEKGKVLPMDVIMVNRPFFSSAVVYIPDGNPTALQLKEYHMMEDKLRRVLSKLAANSVSCPVNEDWDSIARRGKFHNDKCERSVRATGQQVEALKMMATKRLSVLTGSAGTGKTAVVESFIKSQAIQAEGVLLLAPTGKARVRLGSMAGNVTAMTVAQFLTRLRRFDSKLMMAVDNDSAPRHDGARNIIVDECSMLTTRDLYVFIKALDMTKVNRIILIGDPYQLPPIGAGRPFSDLCHFLLRHGQRDELKSAITDLRTVVRTTVSGESDVLVLASWFRGVKPPKDADGIFERIESGELSGDLSVCYWNDGHDLSDKLREAVCTALGCSDADMKAELRAAMGLDNEAELSRNPAMIERFQILTPVLNPVWGTYRLNDVVRQWTGSDTGGYIQSSTQRIYAMDKIINRCNERRQGYPTKREYQLANGQMGFVSNIHSSDNKPQYANIMYAGIPQVTFGYKAVKGEDSDTSVELAYAITVHKSQGSDFDTVIVVLPKSGRIMSRELIYTALTRARKRVVLLVQENAGWLRALCKPQASVLVRRNTCLFEYSVRETRAAIPFVEGLIHRTKSRKNGVPLLVRSKSETVIANELISAGLDFEYEQPLDNSNRIPDFTFVDEIGNKIIWEHLGMMNVPEYRESWFRKLAMYKRMGYTEGVNLFTTEDHPDGSIDTVEVIETIEKIKDMML